MSDAWYPRRDAFYAPVDASRPIFQGDIFRGVPTVFVGHPVAREAAFAEEPAPSPEDAERPLTPGDVRDSIAVHGRRAMIIPHPCDFSENEKGASHTARLVARVRRIGETPFSPKHVANGRVHHTVWVPDPDHDQLGGHDWVVDLRSATPIDRAYLNPARRVAALSGPAWMAVMRRIVHFHTRMAIPLAELALQEAHQHLDYERLPGAFSD